ncbi:MAG: hypothetical protein KatS3mg078_0246 [Deltaproteobacteria bacterium]|nr:MAG: hypothetical protein KatS3mg078_0246 [Deltaproteobacteria bacterium]
MKTLSVLVFALLFVWNGAVFGNEEEVDINVEGAAKKEGFVEPGVLRSTCAYLWDKYYEKEGIEIDVSTRGEQNEVVVFRCPSCNLEEHFVKPFLESEYEGKTGMDRLIECGFLKAVFKGGKGIEEIVVDVPKVKQNPLRGRCAEAWNEYYKSTNGDMMVYTTGEYQETIVFSCGECSFSEEFINVFLNTRYNGKTGLDRLKMCGFIQAVFKGEKAGREIVRDIP